MAREFVNHPHSEEIHGPLPDWVIKDYLKKGIIQIDPLLDNWEEKIDPTTYDFHLGMVLQRLKSSELPIDPLVGVTPEDYEDIDISENPYTFRNGDFVIARTLETLVLPDDIQARLEGKSSLARIGVGVEITSARFDPGWNKQPVLELTNSGPRPIILRAGMAICAFSFYRLEWPVDKSYNGRYKGGTVHSLIHKDNHL